MNRRGVALIAALWLIVVLSTTIGLGMGTIRLGQRTSLNRIALTKGRWAAEGCLAIAQTRWQRDRVLAETTTVVLGRRLRCAWTVTQRSDSLVIAADGWVVGEAPRSRIEVVTLPADARLAVMRRRMW